VLPCAAVLRNRKRFDLRQAERTNERSVSRGSGIIGRQRQAGKARSSHSANHRVFALRPPTNWQPKHRTAKQSKWATRPAGRRTATRGVAAESPDSSPDDAVPFEPNQRHGPHGTHSEGQAGKTSHDDRMTQPPTPAGASRLRLHRPRPLLPGGTASLLVVGLAAQPG
jgi:hypothetical protein